MENLYGRNGIIRVLMNRDEMTKEEAEEFYDDVMAEVQEAIDAGDFEDAEDIFAGEFGLEIDYLLEALL